MDNPAFEEDYENEKRINNDKSDPEKHSNDIVSRTIEKFWTAVGNFYKKNKKLFTSLTLSAIVVLFIAYFIGALLYNVDKCEEEHITPCKWKWCTGHGFLIILTCAVFVGLVYFQLIKRYFGATINKSVLQPTYRVLTRLLSIRVIKFPVIFVILALVVLFLVFDTKGERERLISLIGLFVLLLLGALFSRHPGKIRWRPVLVGLLLQFAFGLFTLRWKTGQLIFECFGNKTTTFLSYTNAGAGFVYGELLLENNVFAFKVLPVIFFFSFFVQILYYWGAMQWIVLKLGWIIQATMGTTVCESVNTAASIFLGQSESPLIIKPYIKDLTKSEIHAIMTAGFATVSGTVLAAYISYGVNASHLLTASIMSAPAAMCYSKLFYPESEESKTKLDNIRLEKGDETGLLDAATKGAMSGISLVLGIIANLVAFVSAISFLDGVIGWFGELVGLTGDDAISFTFILTRIFYPLVWIMGVPTAQCMIVAKLVALKTVVNEFVAYEELGRLMKAGEIFGRSEVIATYALCGFSNPSSIGILIGALSSMAPNRRADIAEVAFRAFLSGCAVCFLTACVAGVLVSEGEFAIHNNSSGTPFPIGNYSEAPLQY